MKKFNMVHLTNIILWVNNFEIKLGGDLLVILFEFAYRSFAGVGYDLLC